MSALFCSSQVQRSCRKVEEEEGDGDVLSPLQRHDFESLSAARTTSQHDSLSSGRTTTDVCPEAKTTIGSSPRLASRPHRPLSVFAASWPSPSQRSWQRGGSNLRLRLRHSEATGRPWRWTSTAPTPRRPSPSTISTRGASSHRMCTCELLQETAHYDIM